MRLRDHGPGDDFNGASAVDKTAVALVLSTSRRRALHTRVDLSPALPVAIASNGKPDRRRPPSREALRLA